MTQFNDQFLSTTSASTGSLLDITLKSSIVAMCVAVNTQTILPAEFVGIMFVVYLSQISLDRLRCFSICRHQTIQRPCYFEFKKLQLCSATFCSHNISLYIHIYTHIYIYIYSYIYVCAYICMCGPGSLVGIATGYGLDVPGIESRWGRDFPHLSRPALGPTQPPVQWILGFSRG